MYLFAIGNHMRAIRTKIPAIPRVVIATFRSALQPITGLQTMPIKLPSELAILRVVERRSGGIKLFATAEVIGPLPFIPITISRNPIAATIDEGTAMSAKPAAPMVKAKKRAFDLPRYTSSLSEN